MRLFDLEKIELIEKVLWLQRAPSVVSLELVTLNAYFLKLLVFIQLSHRTRIDVIK